MCVDSSTCVPLTIVKRLVWFMAGFHFKLNKNVTSFRLRFAHYKIQTNKYCCPHLFLFFSIIFSACALIGCYGILLTAADHCNSCISWHFDRCVNFVFGSSPSKKVGEEVPSIIGISIHLKATVNSISAILHFLIKTGILYV